MSRINQPRPPIYTHEGAKAQHIGPEAQLRRSVMACLLWERTFYEEGQDVADRIASLVPLVKPERVAKMAVEARERMKLRHAPLLLAREMARHATHRPFVEDTIARIVQRPDEITELLAIYAKDREGTKKLGKLAKSIQRGIARAFTKFDAYQLAKYNRKGEVRLRDALFLSHAKPRDEEQAAVWRKLVDGTLEPPDTWEVALSSGADKRTTWERLLSERKLGAMALLRNLRNMKQAGVPEAVVSDALGKMRVDRILPFRFIAAAKHAPTLEPALEEAMLRALGAAEKLPGRTALVVDHSASMMDRLSAKSEMTRFEAACGLAILAREVCEDCVVVAFSSGNFRYTNWQRRELTGNIDTAAKVVPPRRGFALRDALEGAVEWGGTLTQAGVTVAAREGYDRVIVLTDEQSHTSVSNPLPNTRAYVVNVATYQNGIGYGPWTHIDGWSEAVLDYIRESESGQSLVIAEEAISK